MTMLRVTLKSLRGHKLRFTLTTMAVMVGVAFVVGSVVLTDSVRAQFDGLFEDINAPIDLQVRGVERFEGGEFGGNSATPVPEDVLPAIRGVDGVADAEGDVGGQATIIDNDGEAIIPPLFPVGTNWYESDDLRILRLVEGSPPTGPGQVVIDTDTVEAEDFELGQQIQIQTAATPRDFELVGVATFGESNAMVGTTISAFETREAQDLFGSEGEFRTISIGVIEGRDPADVARSVSAVLPPGYEVVPIETVVEEGQDQVGGFIDIFQNVLLGFAGVTLFVSAFLISNTFTIVVGQRTRELALLRAVGATAGQVRSSVLGEALVIALTASLLGFGLGLLTALGLNALLNASGFGAGDTTLVITPISILAGFGVGVIITLVSALVPAIRASRIPPVAAMREATTSEQASLKRRSIAGAVVTALGALSLANALTSGQGGLALLVGMVFGAVAVFIGVALLSPLVARPVVGVLGWPARKLFGATGRLAVGNAGRSPRRTSSTAAALMIGLALVSMALVLGNSIKTSFAATIETAIAADWFVASPTGFLGFSPSLADDLGQREEIGALSAGSQGQMLVVRDRKDIQALDFDVITDLFNLDVVDGDIDGSPGLLVNSDPARILGLQPGDTVTATFNETGEVELPVLAVYDEGSVLGNWIIDLDTFDANFSDDLNYFIAAETAGGFSQDQARVAIDEVLENYPGVRAQDKAEFQADLADQLDSILTVVNVFLLLSILIALLGIMNTLFLSVSERTRELGLLRAVGETTRQIKGMMAIEAVIIALFGALLGVTVGIVFGLAIASTLPEEFITIIDIPILQLAQMIVIAGVFGVLAAFFPAIKASRLDVLEAISFE